MAYRLKRRKAQAWRAPSVTLPGPGRSVYKYFSEHKYAEAFLDGQMLFRSLAYFRDNEDAVRGDEYEGTSTFLPDGGIVVSNQTQGTTFTLPMAFESSVKAYEIFVYCTSRTLSANVAGQFNAVTCVEVRNVKALCTRIRSTLPSTATFRARPVEYYSRNQDCNPRWALPDHIATSKLDYWASQDEYRFLFSFTDALGFEKVALRLVSRKGRPDPKTDEHIDHFLSIGSVRDICVLHDCKTL
jgi:hypothetical protein